MTTEYPNTFSFFNGFKITKRVLLPSELGNDIDVYTDDGWLTFTYTGADSSQWWSFTSPEISEVVILGLLNRSGGTTRYTDNEKAVAASTQLWINDNMFSAPTSTWQNNIINLFNFRIDIIHDATTTPVVRSYQGNGTGRISTDSEQPGCIDLTVFRFN